MRGARHSPRPHPPGRLEVATADETGLVFLAPQASGPTGTVISPTPASWGVPASPTGPLRLGADYRASRCSPVLGTSDDVYGHASSLSLPSYARSPRSLPQRLRATLTSSSSPRRARLILARSRLRRPYRSAARPAGTVETSSRDESPPPGEFEWNPATRAVTTVPQLCADPPRPTQSETRTARTAPSRFHVNSCRTATPARFGPQTPTRLPVAGPPARLWTLAASAATRLARHDLACARRPRLADALSLFDNMPPHRSFSSLGSWCWRRRAAARRPSCAVLLRTSAGGSQATRRSSRRRIVVGGQEGGHGFRSRGAWCRLRGHLPTLPRLLGCWTVAGDAARRCGPQSSGDSVGCT